MFFIPWCLFSHSGFEWKIFFILSVLFTRNSQCKITQVHLTWGMKLCVKYSFSLIYLSKNLGWRAIQTKNAQDTKKKKNHYSSFVFVPFVIIGLSQFFKVCLVFCILLCIRWEGSKRLGLWKLNVNYGNVHVV